MNLTVRELELIQSALTAHVNALATDRTTAARQAKTWMAADSDLSLAADALWGALGEQIYALQDLRSRIVRELMNTSTDAA